MKKGELSADEGQAYGFNFDDLFYPLTGSHSKGRLNNALMSWTKGAWALVFDLLKIRAGARSHLRKLADYATIHFFLIESRVPAWVAKSLLEKYKIPYASLIVVDDKKELAGLLLENDIVRFRTMDGALIPYIGLKMFETSLFVEWAHLN
jgi:hypothetical protein